jgi:hypothetical protein
VAGRGDVANDRLADMSLHTPGSDARNDGQQTVALAIGRHRLMNASISAAAN